MQRKNVGILYYSKLFTDTELTKLLKGFAKCNARKFKTLQQPVALSLLSFIPEPKTYYITEANESQEGIKLYGVNKELQPVSFLLSEFEYKEDLVTKHWYKDGTVLGQIKSVQEYYYKQVTGKATNNYELAKLDIINYLKTADIPEEEVRQTYKEIKDFYKWLDDADKDLLYIDIYNEGREYYSYLLECLGAEAEAKALEKMMPVYMYLQFINYRLRRETVYTRKERPAIIIAGRSDKRNILSQILKYIAKLKDACSKEIIRQYYKQIAKGSNTYQYLQQVQDTLEGFYMPSYRRVEDAKKYIGSYIVNTFMPSDRTIAKEILQAYRRNVGAFPQPKLYYQEVITVISSCLASLD